VAKSAERDWLKPLERGMCPLPALKQLETIAVGNVWGERFHSTPSHELIHVLQGSAEIQYRKRVIAVVAGDTFIIPEGTQHRDVKSQGEQYRVLYTFFRWPAGKAIIGKLDTAALIKLAGAPRTHLQMLVRQLESEFLGGAEGSTRRMQLILLEIILALVRYSHAASPRVTEARRVIADTRRRKLADEVHAHLTEHCTDSISLEALAERFDVSPFHLCRTYTQTFGVSMTDMIARMRIERAAEWLKAGDASVKAAAARSGFSDPNYFAKVFRKVLGMSPSQYQASVRAKS
jgi:AraC-like DNA-binding protein